ncbi:MAG: glucose-6-phosphate dehydrogenase assembly protein OpcA [Polyangiaceae bacterium]|nr:glucose-6-phosphate dehydrogenase assembly protein OpcA [Polyangiaceae bacterium]
MTAPASGRVSDVLASIEGAIRALWKPDAAGRARARAATLNLVCVTGVEQQAEFVQVADEVSTRLLARTFLIVVDPRAEPWGLEGTVSAVSSGGSAGGAVTAERIELRLGAAASKRAQSVVEALLAPRLPVALLVGPGAHASVVDQLAPHAGRVVLDSAQCGVARAAAVAELTPGRIEDLAFVRGRRWREMLARFFDDPSLVPALGAVRRLAIEHAATPERPASAEADLVLGWLGARLGWRVEGGALVASDGARPTIQRRPVARDDLVPGWLASIEIEAELPAGQVVGRAARDESSEVITWSLAAPWGALGPRRFLVPRREPAELAARAVSDPFGDTLAREALTLAAAWSRS